jgi:hypothetical protein
MAETNSRNLLYCNNSSEEMLSSRLPSLARMLTKITVFTRMRITNTPSYKSKSPMHYLLAIRIHTNSVETI